jgi:hypothetical protein
MISMPAGGLDLDIDARRQTELVQRLDGFGRRLHDVDEPLVGTDLELLAGFLVNVGAGQDGVAFNACGQGNRPMDYRTGTFRRIDDLHRALIQDGVIVRFHTDPNDFAGMTGHGCPPGFLLPACQSTPATKAGNLKYYPF